MTTYLVTIVADSRQACVKMCLMACVQREKTAGAYKKSSSKIQEKPYGGGGNSTPPLYARGLQYDLKSNTLTTTQWPPLNTLAK